VDRLERQGQLPRVSQLLPEALDLAHLPGIVKTLIKAIPDSVVDRTLPTGPLLRRTVDELDVNQVLRELGDPSQLQSTVRSAILHAALSEILDRLRP
jgi:hypothetical protein